MIRDKAKDRLIARKRRHFRIRKKISGTPERPRLVVRKTLKHMIAQIFDDVNGKSLVQMNTTIIKDKMTKTEKARLLGKMLAERALSLGIKKVVFDRGGYPYHGRVKALAEGAREGGLEF